MLLINGVYSEAGTTAKKNPPPSSAEELHLFIRSDHFSLSIFNTITAYRQQYDAH